VKHPILHIEELSDEFYQVSDLDLRDLSRLRIWLWDLEATGLDTSVERVTQIAGIPLQAGQLIEEEAFKEFVFPGEGVEIPKVVRDLTGITLDMLEGAALLPEVWARCLEAAGAADVWVGQSVFEFDVPLLHAEFARHGMPDELPPILDSVVMATALLGEIPGRWSTSALIERFGVSTDGLRRHDALDDVKILGRILIPLLRAFARERGDRLRIPAAQPLRVRRHPPITSDSGS
jgi:DNA polymerase III alpha subunit (gram-positive type)